MLYSVPLLLSALLLMPAFSVQAEPVPVARQALETKDVAITQRNADLAIDIHYPVTGYPDVDRDIKDWAEQQAQAFKLTSAEPHTNPYELSTSYVLTSPSARYLSLVWEIFTYTGGAHSNLEITTFTYATATGKTVDLYDVFGDLDQALALASVYSAKKLENTLGDMADAEMIQEGTTPDAENFSRFALTPAGIRFYFPPYQVAPWAAGMQTVDIPLAELAPARPQVDLWAR